MVQAPYNVPSALLVKFPWFSGVSAAHTLPRNANSQDCQAHCTQLKRQDPPVTIRLQGHRGPGVELQAHPVAVYGRVGQREVHYSPLLLDGDPVMRHGAP